MDDSPMTLERFMRGYSRWLVDMLGMEDHEMLFGILYDTEFTWKIDRDENRATDGVYMRDRYSYETGEYLPDSWRDWPCSLAEMLASLAFTMEESFLYDPDGETGCDKWMQEMLENCGLWKLDDRTFEAHPAYSFNAVEDIVETVLDRKYGYSGDGGLFPLSNPDEDQRDVEIWYQMNAYILEKWSMG